MARRNRVSVAEIVVEPATRSLASVVRELDDQLDTAIVDTKAERAVVAANPDGPQALAGKLAPADDQAWARDEIDVVRRLFAPGRAVNARSVGPGGEFGRALERHALGTSHARTTGTYEPPTSGGGGHSAAARVVWDTLSEAQRALLAGMYASLRREFDGGARSIAGKVREHMREGALLAAREEIVWLNATLLDLHKLTPTQLLALSLGRLMTDADSETIASVTSAVGAELKAARATFRERLRMVDLNDALSKLKDASDIPRERRPLLIPAPTLKDLEGDRVETVLACIGGVVIVDGCRLPCEIDVVRADVTSWPRCEVCGKPKR